MQCAAIRFEQFFSGYVVLVSFEMAYMNKDIILDQIHEEQTFWHLYVEHFSDSMHIRVHFF